MSRSWTILSLASAALLALGLRALPYPEVFPSDGVVELAAADSAYHARRALFSFVNFPAALRFDPYVAWPDGAVAPMPPLYDWALAGVARAFGDSEATFERVAAWWSPVLSALTVAPVFLIGRAVGGSGVGLAAAFLFALLPAGARRSMLGDVDHHAAIALLGAAWLAASIELVKSQRSRVVSLGAGLAAIRVAMLLSWSGSLLYVLLGEGALLLANAIAGRPAPAWAQAASAAAAAAGVALWLGAAGSSGAHFSTTDVSWLHVLALVAAALVAVATALTPRLGATNVARRVGVAAGAGVLLAVALLVALPGARESLGSGLAFFAKQDSWGGRNFEQQALFSPAAPGSSSPALRNYGWLAYAIPLAWAATLARLRDPALRPAASCLACWSLVLGALALAQLRFGSDFAPAASVGFALLFAAGARRLPRRVPTAARAAACVVLCGLLLWPGLAASYLRPTRVALAYAAAARDRRPEDGPAPLSASRSLTGFARMVRRATPETSGYFDARGRPEYGVLSKPSHGHTLHYFARRATPANNLGPYLDWTKYSQALRFYQVASEAAAVAIAERLGVRYVVTFARETAGAGGFADRLHGPAGVGSEEHSERFRLVTEGPPGGTPQRSNFPSGNVPRRVVPYKLFELVEGAVLEARAAPGTEMEVRLPLHTPIGRRTRFRARARADATGRIALRVPYATGPADTPAATRTLGPYRVQLGEAQLTAEVSERDVRSGAIVRVGAP